MTRFKLEWPYDGARELEVVVDQELPDSYPIEQRVRSMATIARSHGGLRLLLETSFAERYHVNVLETVGGVTTIRLMPIQ